MPRTAHRFTALPADSSQFINYLHSINSSNNNGIYSKPEVIEQIRESLRIFLQRDTAFSESYTNAIVSGMVQLGFLKDEDDKLQVTNSVQIFLEDETSYSPKGYISQLSKFGNLLLDVMTNELGWENINPLIADQLSYMFQKMRNENKNMKNNNKWTIPRILEKTSTVSDSTYGFTYDDLSKEGRNRIAQEYLKIFSWLGILEKDSNKSEWEFTINEKNEEKIRIKLQELRFEWQIETIIKKMGENHRYFSREKNNAFYKKVSRYMVTRYSSEGKRTRKFKNDIIESLFKKKIKADDDTFHLGLRGLLEYEFNNQKGSKRNKINSNHSILDIIRKLNEIKCEMLLKDVNITDNIGEIKDTLKSMSIEEIDEILSEGMDSQELTLLLLSRGKSKKYNRLNLTNLSHDEGIFTIPEDFTPYNWQTECVEKWVNGNLSEGHKPFTGIANAVTGTGKTLMALMAISKFIQKYPDAVVSVVVPTKILMYQWAEESAKFLGLGSEYIGFVGDGFTDNFSSKRRLLIWVVNSAVKNDRLNNEINSIDEKIPHLLIADECHEYGGEKFRRFLDCRSEGKLAISATPPDQDSEGKKHPILLTMGTIFYSLGYKQAYTENLISGFRIKYLSIELRPRERRKYDRFSDEISRLNRELEQIYGPQLEGGNLIARLQSILKSDGGGRGSAVISQFLRAIRERKNIIKDATNRSVAQIAVINYNKKIHDEGRDLTTILFHEQIDETMKWFGGSGQGTKVLQEKELKDAGDEEGIDILKAQMIIEDHVKNQLLGQNNWIRFGMYHSNFPNPWGRWMIDWFRDEKLNTMWSAKALAQGFDMPGADVGIIRSSTSNVRQRIQTIGRLIRKKKDDEIISEIWIIYVSNTTDERIFTKHDWHQELPDIPVEKQEDEVQTKWKIPEWEINEDGIPIDIDGQDICQGSFVPFFDGGFESLPQPDRELTDEELESIDVEGLECGDEYPDSRAIKSSSYIIRVSESGDMTHIDNGAPFDFDYEPLKYGSNWLSKNRKKRGIIHVLTNGHAVARSVSGNVVFISEVNLDEIQRLIEDIDDSFDEFMKGFKS
jgi:superfamily II DNA or RNA helicase